MWTSDQHKHALHLSVTEQNVNTWRCCCTAAGHLPCSLFTAYFRVGLKNSFDVIATYSHSMLVLARQHFSKTLHFSTKTWILNERKSHHCRAKNAVLAESRVKWLCQLPRSHTYQKHQGERASLSTRWERPTGGEEFTVWWLMSWCTTSDNTDVFYVFLRTEHERSACNTDGRLTDRWLINLLSCICIWDQ